MARRVISVDKMEAFDACYIVGMLEIAQDVTEKVALEVERYRAMARSQGVNVEEDLFPKW